MMKIGMVSSAYTRFGEDRYLKMKEHGYSCVDYGMINTDIFPYSCSEEEMIARLLKEKALAEAAGIEFSQVHGPWRYPPTDDTKEKREVRLGEMQKSIRATAMLGCKNWVVHPIMPYGVGEKDTPESDKTWELNVDFMRKLLVTARECDVTICLENMPFVNFTISTPDKILELVQLMNDDHFKICLDTGHVAVFPECNLADVVRKLGKEIRVLHVHDNNGKADQHQLPYFGVIDWKAFYAALKDIGYEGCFSLESKIPQALPDDLYEELCRFQVRMVKEICS